MKRYVLFDTETTGLGDDSRACEVAWLEFDGAFNVLDRQRSLIDPEAPISPQASGVHGITDDMVFAAPTINEYFTIVHDNPFGHGEVVFVAHNAPFDLKYISPHLGRHAGTICTLKCARRIYPDAPDHKLQTLRYMLGLKVEGADAHSASGDVEVAFAVLKRMAEDAELSLEGLMELSNMPGLITKMPFGKHRGDLLRDLPTQYVYWLLNKADIDEDLRYSLQTLN